MTIINKIQSPIASTAKVYAKKGFGSALKREEAALESTRLFYNDLINRVGFSETFTEDVFQKITPSVKKIFPNLRFKENIDGVHSQDSLGSIVKGYNDDFIVDSYKFFFNQKRNNLYSVADRIETIVHEFFHLATMIHSPKLQSSRTYQTRRFLKQHGLNISDKTPELRMHYAKKGHFANLRDSLLYNNEMNQKGYDAFCEEYYKSPEARNGAIKFRISNLKTKYNLGVKKVRSLGDDRYADSSSYIKNNLDLIKEEKDAHNVGIMFKHKYNLDRDRALSDEKVFDSKKYERMIKDEIDDNERFYCFEDKIKMLKELFLNEARIERASHWSGLGKEYNHAL